MQRKGDLHEADCHLKQTEPYSPYVDHCTDDQDRFPKKPRNHTIILMALICPCSTNSIYMTARHVPETFMTKETADISQICQFGWFDWVMYHDPAKFPDDKAILGRYLGPTIDFGSMLMAKILLPNGQYVCRPMLRTLTTMTAIMMYTKPIDFSLTKAIDQKP